MGTIKRILLTGGTGYLGSHLLKSLIQRDFEVTLLKRSSSNINRIKDVIQHISLYDVDTNLKTLFEVKKFDAVIHVAASYGRDSSDLNTIIEPNLLLPLKLLQNAIDYNVPYFLNTDTSLPKYVNSYALTKKQFLDWLEFFKDKVTVLNIELQYFYGPGDDDWKFITGLIRKFLNREAFIDFTIAQQERDFVYIDDVISAYLLLIDKLSEFEKFTNVEVGSGKALKLKELITKLRLMCNAHDTTLNFGVIPLRTNEIMFSQANNKILNNLGWKPSFSLDEGLQKTIEKEKLYANN